MSHIVAYLNFDGNCRQAMQFYQECLGGKLDLMTVADSPMAAQMPAEMGQYILHSNLSSGGINLMASDMNAGKVQQGNAVHLCIVCDTAAELDNLFEKLSVGGSVTHAPEKFFAGTMGNFTDQFGMHWQLYCGEGMQQ